MSHYHGRDEWSNGYPDESLFMDYQCSELKGIESLAKECTAWRNSVNLVKLYHWIERVIMTMMMMMMMLILPIIHLGEIGVIHSVTNNNTARKAHVLMSGCDFIMLVPN